GVGALSCAGSMPSTTRRVSSSTRRIISVSLTSSPILREPFGLIRRGPAGGSPPNVSSVARYVALLRAINVSGRNKIAMTDLQQLCTAAGHTDVVTYVQSGNVVFTSRAGQAKAIAESLSERIKNDLGFDVTVLVR